MSAPLGENGKACGRSATRGSIMRAASSSALIALLRASTARSPRRASPARRGGGRALGASGRSAGTWRSPARCRRSSSCSRPSPRGAPPRARFRRRRPDDLRDERAAGRIGCEAVDRGLAIGRPGRALEDHRAEVGEPLGHPARPLRCARQTPPPCGADRPRARRAARRPRPAPLARRCRGAAGRSRRRWRARGLGAPRRRRRPRARRAAPRGPAVSSASSSAAVSASIGVAATVSGGRSGATSSIRRRRYTSRSNSFSSGMLRCATGTSPHSVGFSTW